MDILDWLNSAQEAVKEEAGGNFLLLAPVDGEGESESDGAESAQESEQPEEKPVEEREVTEGKITALNDAWGVSDEAEAVDDTHSSRELTDSLTDNQPQQESAKPTDTHTYNTYSDETDPESHSSMLNQAWHEASDLTININEPPQEMWTDIGEDDNNDEPPDYIETSSLQGDAYIPIVKHGSNFTQRLQATLQGRKERAARQREFEEQNANHHPYLQKAIILCTVLLMSLGFAYLGLWFIQRETPDGINERAVKLYDAGRFDEAEALYTRAYTRYPHVLTFLTGIARSAEKASHPQTAIAAWNEYISSLPKDDNEHRTLAQNELARIIPGNTHEQPKTEPKPEPEQPKQEAPSQPVQKTTRPGLPEIKPLTFDEALSEGNHAFNIGMYSRAVSNFHKAHAINENDIRPYIGLAGAYRAKGMYFDAKRLLDEARRKFGRNPTLEVEMNYLKGE